MKKRILFLTVLLVLVASPVQARWTCDLLVNEAAALETVLGVGDFAGTDKETEQLIEAKERIFKGDWKEAQGRLNSYLRTYPSGRYRDEVLYWLARSLNKLSREEKRPAKVIALKEEAVVKLDLLLEQYPKSLWLDDAEALKIEVAGELALMGKEKYKEFIETIIATHKVGGSDLKIAALNMLMELEPEAAIPTIETIIRTDEDPVFRKMCVFLLAKHYPEAAKEILKMVKEEDPDAAVQKEAAYWIERNQMLQIPAQLNYFGYIARLTDPDEHDRIRENKVNVVDFPRIGSTNKKKVERALKRFFDKKLSEVKFVTNGVRGTGIDYFTSRISHRMSGFRVEVLDDGLVKEYDRISGKASFYDLEDNKEFVVSYTVDDLYDKLLAVRKGNNVALLVLQFESHEEELELDDEPVYNTEFSNVLGCAVFSSRQTWGLDEMTQRNGVTDFGRAKALIPGEGGRWALFGSILLSWKEHKFVARKAELVSPDGKTMAKAAQIIVPADNPAAFEVVSEQEK